LKYVIVPLQTIWGLRFPDRDKEVQTLVGRLLVFSPRKNLIGQALYACGVWEPEVTATIASETKPGMIALDVGADIGYYSMHFSRLVGKAGRVIAFEPIPKARERLVHNIALNKLDNIEVSEFALGNQEGIVFLEDPFTKSRVNLKKTTGGAHDIQVSIKRFDDLIDGSLPSIDIIKMDIEGAEHEALRGMEQTLRRCKPVIVLEVHNHFLPLFNSTSDALLDWLSKLGYEIRTVEVDGPEDARTTTVCCKPNGNGVG
jgi:FkbM family methyltransferase